MKNLVVHFEIFVDDIERAKNFYSQVLGWAFSHIEQFDYWLVFPTGEISQGPAAQGINGGMVLRRNAKPQDDTAAPNAFVCTVSVEDIDAVVDKAVKSGARLDMPIDTVPGIGRLAYIRDTEGNLVGLLEAVPMETA